jgi:hypothetical protein
MTPSLKVFMQHEVDGKASGPMLPGDVLVEFHWDGVVRPCSSGIVLRERHLKRLTAAFKAGALFKEVRVKRDIRGKTYVDATCEVSAKTINADLKRLGF